MGLLDGILGNASESMPTIQTIAQVSSGELSRGYRDPVTPLCSPIKVFFVNSQAHGERSTTSHPIGAVPASA